MTFIRDITSIFVDVEQKTPLMPYPKDMTHRYTHGETDISSVWISAVYNEILPSIEGFKYYSHREECKELLAHYIAIFIQNGQLLKAL